MVSQSVKRIWRVVLYMFYIHFPSGLFQNLFFRFFSQLQIIEISTDNDSLFILLHLDADVTI